MAEAITERNTPDERLAALDINISDVPTPLYKATCAQLNILQYMGLNFQWQIKTNDEDNSITLHIESQKIDVGFVQDILQQTQEAYKAGQRQVTN